MIEWFNNLSDGNKIAIVVPVGLAFLMGVAGLIKLFFFSKNAPVPQKTIQQKGNKHKATIADNNKGIIVEGDLNIGISPEIKAALKTLNTDLGIIDSDQSNKLASELNDIPEEKLNSLTVISQDQNNEKQKLQLEKEFELYSELWKALDEVRTSVIITPTLDRIPKDKSIYDVYKERFDIACCAFNKAREIFDKNRPFIHDDVSTVTKEFLALCRGYIFSVQKMLSSEEFDDQLHDEADNLYNVVPKAIDEIEKAIKIRTGLLPKPEISTSTSIGSGLGSIVEITNGSIVYDKNSLKFKPLEDLKMSIIGGYIKRNKSGKLEAYIQTDIPFQSLQVLNKKLGLDSMHLISESDTLSDEVNNPVIFTSSTEHILPQGEKILNLETWQEIPLPMTFHVQTQTTVSGHLEGKVFQGIFEATLTYKEISLQMTLKGTCQAELA